MAAIGWQAKLDAARNEDDVASVCNEFLATWSAAELAEIPSSCRPEGTSTPESISPYANRLIAAVGVGNRAAAPALHRMSTFFTKAALRLADVMSIGSPDRSRRNPGAGPPTTEG